MPLRRERYMTAVSKKKKPLPNELNTPKYFEGFSRDKLATPNLRIIGFVECRSLSPPFTGGLSLGNQSSW
jgi:hypothetical protein